MKKVLRTILSLALVGGTFFSVGATQYIDPSGFVYDLNESDNTAKLTLVIAPVNALTDVEIPASVDANGASYSLTEIGDRAFYGNKNVVNITGGENISVIGKSSFYGCTSLASFAVPEGLKKVDEMAFYQCSALEGFQLNDGIEEIGHFAFWENKLMSSADIPASVTTIGENPFGMCQKITQINVAEDNANYASVDGILFDKDVTKLISYPNGNYLNFYYTLPETVKVIGSNSFYGNVSIMGVTMPEGLEEIGGGALRQCNLMKVEIPSTVTKIGAMAFMSNTSLASFTVAEGNTEYKSAEGQLLSADGKHLIAGAVSGNPVIVPEGVEDIDAYAFFKLTKIKGVKLPSSARTIGQSAFYGCSGITEFDFGDGIEVIGTQAFQLCSKLTEVKLPASMREIGMQAFTSCNMLSTLELNEGLVSIGAKAFMTLPMLKKVVIPGTLETMEDAAFFMCPSLAEVEINEGVTSLGKSCFSSCSSLTSVTFPSTLKSIGDDAFTYTGLSEIELPEGLETIGDASFSSCQLKEVVLPETTKSIGLLAFSNNYPMESFIAGSALEVIGDNAFVNNANLTKIELNEGLLSIGENAMAYCDKLNTLTIPSTVTTLGKYFLNGSANLDLLVNNAVEPQVLAADIFNPEVFDGYEFVELFVPADCKSLYESAPIWSKFVTINEEESGLTNISVESKTVDAIYDLQGRRMNDVIPGVNIVRYTDGTTSKVVVK